MSFIIILTLLAELFLKLQTFQGAGLLFYTPKCEYLSVKQNFKSSSIVSRRGSELSETTRSNNTIDSITFFPWNDNIDYNELCRSIKKQFDEFKTPLIIHDGTRGGLGHKSIYIFYSFAYGLLNRRPVKCKAMYFS